MLKLLCTNNKVVVHPNGIRSYGEGLREGEIYTAAEATQRHPNNKMDCYFIEELQDLKLVSRFIPLSDIDETELVNEEALKKPSMGT